jgi:hypothetical protein
MSSIIGTMIRSWKMRIDRETRPCGLFISARCWRMRRTMAVEERATRKPKKVAWPGS